MWSQQENLTTDFNLYPTGNNVNNIYQINSS